MEPDLKSGLPQKDLVIAFANSLPDDISNQLNSILKKYDDSVIKTRLRTISEKIETLNKKINSFLTFNKKPYLLEKESLLLENDQLNTDLSTIMNIYKDYNAFLKKEKKISHRVVTYMFFMYIRKLYGIPEFWEESADNEIPSQYVVSYDGGRRKATRHRRKQYRKKTINKNKKRRFP